MRLPALALLLIACAGKSDGDDTSGLVGCTEMGCTEGFDLAFLPAITGSGSFSVELVADEASITCTASLPFDEADLGGCTDPNVYLSLSGTELPDDQQEIPGIYLGTTPASLGITVKRDGAIIGEGSFSPVYETLQPNGPDCGPICSYDSDSLPISG